VYLIRFLCFQGIKTARVAGKGAIRSVLEATRTLELLTLGAYYTTSSTAFVTFKTRSARSISCQMLLSHEVSIDYCLCAYNCLTILFCSITA
jgi:hypothetical protein